MMMETPLEADAERRFGGLARLYGQQGAQRIRQAHVAVVGIGGVGSWVAEALARSGVGGLTLIDMDHVAESNVNRQIHAMTSTLGKSKIEAMRERIAEIHPACQIRLVDDFVAPANWPDLLPEPITALVDACDQVAAKTAMAAWSLRTKTLFVTVGAAGGKRLGHKVEMDDLALVTHDPLLAQLRYRLRKHHGAARDAKKKIGVVSVFSREPVAPPDISCQIEQADGSLNCHGYGSSVAVTATFGMCAAGFLLDQLAR